MLHIGGAELIPVELFPEPPPPPAPPTRPPNGRDNMERTATTDDRVTSTDDAIEMFGTTSSILSQSTSGHSYAPVPLRTPSPPVPSPTLETQSTRIVGPMVYLYFSAANTSDAGFTVDLLFQHPSYFEASPLFILL